MGLYKGFIMSMGMFSTIPAGKNSWDDKYMHLIIPSLHLVGGVIGFIWFILSYFIMKTNIPELIQSAIILFIPFFLSGFLHIDGYMDTSDAIFSRRNLEEKRKILKDSHVGAFAVIALLVLFVFQFAAIQTIIVEDKNIFGFIFIPIISRVVTGVSLLNLKPMSNTGYLVMFKANTNKKHTYFTIITGLLALIISFFISTEIFVSLLGVLVFGSIVAFYVYKELDGLSGDLCGCITTLGEVFGLLFLAIY